MHWRGSTRPGISSSSPMSVTYRSWKHRGRPHERCSPGSTSSPSDSGRNRTMFNLAIILRESADAFSDKPAMFFDGGRMTYGELDAASDSVAEGLTETGIRPG